MKTWELYPPADDDNTEKWLIMNAQDRGEFHYVKGVEASGITVVARDGHLDLVGDLTIDGDVARFRGPCASQTR